MKKFSIIFLIFLLVLVTAIIKNSTKRFDDEIFVLEENLRSLKKDYANSKLEHDYLSSSEKLFEIQKEYFDNELVKKTLSEIKIINQNLDSLKIKQLSIINEK